MKNVEIFTDGACSGNPGPGGWGAVLRYKTTEKEISGGSAKTTNNRMEMTAVIEALKLLKEPCTVCLQRHKQGLGEKVEVEQLDAKQDRSCIEPRFMGNTA